MVIAPRVAAYEIGPLEGVGAATRCHSEEGNHRGDLPQAIPLLERSLALCQVADVPHLLAVSVSHLGSAYAQAGRVAEAIPLMEQAVEIATSLRQGNTRELVLALLSEVYLRAGRIEDASDVAQQALALSREHNRRGRQVLALRLLGEIAAQRNPPDTEGAERHYREALALAEEIGMRPLQAHCHNGLGTLYLKMGQQEQARSALSTAIALYRAMAMTFWLPQAEATLALLNSHYSRGPARST